MFRRKYKHVQNSAPTAYHTHAVAEERTHGGRGDPLRRHLIGYYVYICVGPYGLNGIIGKKIRRGVEVEDFFIGWLRLPKDAPPGHVVLVYECICGLEVVPRL